MCLGRRIAVFAGMIAAVAGGMAGFAAGAVSAGASVPLSIAIAGNHFVNGSGQTIRLLGIDRPGTEYACEEGYAYSNGDDAPAQAASDAAAIAAWDANAVRVPLNEDCWLGINGMPAYGTQAGYRQMIETYVAALHADGIYAILDLHWSAPGAVVSDAQRAMPDDHSVAFWTSVADTFKRDPAVVFDVFNEPYSPAADGFTSYPVSWGCWLNGGCSVPDAADGDTPDPADTYAAVGMQALVDAIRATGASEPIMVGGLSYANDLSGWLANEPSDPDGQLAASFHNYEGESCDDSACWQSVIAPIAAEVPVVTGEFDQDECPAGTDDFDDTYMNWADQNGVSYLAWGWYAGVTPDCGDYYLIDATGAPAAPNGLAVHDHLTALAAATTTTTQTTTTETATTTTTQTDTQPAPTRTAPSQTPATTTTTPTPKARPKPPCVVPRLAGDSLLRARRRLRAAHCTPGRVSDPRRRRRHLVVASSSPRAGAHRPDGAKVTLRMAAYR